MELVLLVLIAVIVLWWIGGFSMLETTAGMANAEVEMVADKQYKRHTDWYSKNVTDDEAVEQAKENMKKFREARRSLADL